MLKEHRQVYWHLFPLRIVTLLALIIGTLVFIILGISLWAPLVVCILVCIWLVDPQSIYVQLFACLGLLCLFFLFSAHASRAESEFWLLRAYSTPAGKSSCTSSTSSSQPYNAAAFYDYTNVSFLNEHHGYCPFPDFRWGDATLSEPEGVLLADTYETNPETVGCPSCTFAPTRPKAYVKNPGRGLSHGFYAGANVIDTSLCPGVARTINKRGIIGTGLPICTTCTAMFTAAGLIPENTCNIPVRIQDALCFMCPGWSRTESNSTLDLRAMAEWIFYWVIHVLAYAVFHILSLMVNGQDQDENVKKNDEKKQSNA